MLEGVGTKLMCPYLAVAIGATNCGTCFYLLTVMDSKATFRERLRIAPVYFANVLVLVATLIYALRHPG